MLPSPSRTRFSLVVGLLLTPVLVVAAWGPVGALYDRCVPAEVPVDSPFKEVYAVCRDCGPSPDDVDRLIIDMLGSRPNLSREQQYEMFIEQFSEPHLRERCEPCVEAILDAVNAPYGRSFRHRHQCRRYTSSIP